MKRNEDFGTIVFMAIVLVAGLAMNAAVVATHTDVFYPLGFIAYPFILASAITLGIIWGAGQ